MNIKTGYIDLSAIFWRCWFGSGTSLTSRAIERTIEYVEAAAGECEQLVVCIDSSRSLRKEENPEYKANRPEKDKDSVAQLKRTIELLGQRFTLASADGYEADDVIASVLVPGKGRIYTADKDLMVLVTDDIDVFDTRTGEVFGPKEVKEKWGVEPGLITEMLILEGDTSDNIKGVQGCGNTKARMLLDKYGSARNACANWASMFNKDGSLGALSNSLMEHLDLGGLELATQMATLRNCADVIKMVHPTGVPDEEVIEEVEVSVVSTALSTTVAEPAPLAVATAETGFLNTFQSMLLFSQAVAQSSMYGEMSAETALCKLMMGKDLGIPPTVALGRGVHVINGEPTISAHMLHALADRSPDCLYFKPIEETDEYVVWETHKKGHDKPMQQRFSMDDARLAGLGKKPNSPWKRNPKAMLNARCKSTLARLAYPVETNGMYATEEMEK